MSTFCTFHQTSRLVPEASFFSHFAIVLIPSLSRLGSDFHEFNTCCCLKGGVEMTHQMVPVDHLTPGDAFPKVDTPTATLEFELIEERRSDAVP